MEGDRRRDPGRKEGGRCTGGGRRGGGKGEKLGEISQSKEAQREGPQ